MTRRSQRQLLLAANAVLAAGLLAVVAAAFLPPSDPPAHGKLQARRANDTSDRDDQIAPVEAYAPIYQRPLRRALFDPPPVAPVEVKVAAPPPPNLHPVATAVEPGASYGMFRSANGEVRIVQIGETIDGAELVSVTENSVTVRVSDRLVTLPVEKAGG